MIKNGVLWSHQNDESPNTDRSGKMFWKIMERVTSRATGVISGLWDTG